MGINTVNKIIQVSDGNYLVVGNNINGTTRAYFAKLGLNGNALWSSTYSAGVADKAYFVKETSDNGFIIAGSSNNGTNLDALLIRLDASGNLVWAKTYDYNSDNDTENYSVNQTADGGFLLTFRSDNGGTPKFVVVKTTADGSIDWSKQYALAGISKVTIGMVLSDGSFAFLGTKSTSTAGAVFIKTDNAGAITWAKNVVNGNNFKGDDFDEIPGVGYILIGQWDFINADIGLVKLDNSGNAVFGRRIDGNNTDVPSSVRALASGEFLLSGSANRGGSLGFEGFILKVDASANTVVSKQFGGSGAQTINDAILTSDGGFLGVGLKSNQLWLVKTNSNGEAGCTTANFGLFTNTTQAASTSNLTFTTTTGGVTAANATGTLSSVTSTTTNVCVPEINVRFGATNILDGDNTPSLAEGTDFDQVNVGFPQSRVFQIQNLGTGLLNLTGNPVVSITGANASEFVVTVPPASSIVNGSNSNFTVVFTPTALGLRTAEISISNDDSNENPYNFSIQGTGATPGAALDFDGTNDVVEAPDNQSYANAGSSFTIECWIKSTDNAADGNMALVTNYGGTGQTPNFRLGFNTSIFLWIRDVSNVERAVNFPKAGIIDGTWHHLAGVRDAATSMMHLYVDGVLVKSGAATTGNLRFGSTLSIMDHFNGYTQGTIDEVRIWSVARSCEEISQYKNFRLWTQPLYGDARSPALKGADLLNDFYSFC